MQKKIDQQFARLKGEDITIVDGNTVVIKKLNIEDTQDDKDNRKIKIEQKREAQKILNNKISIKKIQNVLGK